MLLAGVQMRWLRRRKFSVGRNFYGWAVESGTVYVAGGRVDSRTCQCTADVRCVSAERIVRGCDSPCDAGKINFPPILFPKQKAQLSLGWADRMPVSEGQQM